MQEKVLRPQRKKVAEPLSSAFQKDYTKLVFLPPTYEFSYPNLNNITFLILENMRQK